MKLLFTSSIIFICFSVLGQPTEGKLLGHWDDPSIVGTAQYDNRYNEVWGISGNGKEYAIIGSTKGTHFIDVTDPANPTESFFVAGKAHGNQIVHRDYHDYGCYLFAGCGEGNSSLQIMDISQLPDTVTVVYDSDDMFIRTHNLFIDSSAARLYTFAESRKGAYNAMGVYDISDPVNPVYLKSFNTFAGINASHVHDGFIQKNIAYLNLGGDGMAIIDYTDLDNPIPLGTLTNYEDRGYNHSGWATPDNKYYYMADENWGYQLKAIDVSDPTDITVSKLFDADALSPKSIAHNQILACNYLYVSYYFDGLQVYDVSDPLNPQRVMYYDTYPGETIKDYKGAWGVFPFLPSGNILVSDMQTGLYVVEGIDDGCKEKQNTNCDSFVATNNLNSNVDQFNVFPNPISDFLNVKIDFNSNNVDVVDLQITDISGQIILTQKEKVQMTNNWQMDLTNFQNGFYILNIKSKNLFLSRKVVVSN